MKAKIYFNSIGVLTSYNVELPKALSSLGLNMYIDAEVNLTRLFLIREKIFHGYKPNLCFVSTFQKLISQDLLRKYFNRFNVLHLNSARSSLVRKIVRLSNRPKILVLHQAPLPETIYDEIADFIDVFVAPSEFTAKNEMKKIGSKPIVIHHGVNTKLFNPFISKEVARRILRIPLNSKVVLWNDRISPEKDLKTMFKAIPLIAKEVHEIYFYIKGRAVDRKYFKNIRRIFEKVKAISKVRIHIGWIFHEKLPMLYRAADIFIRTSLHENFGLGFIESMACGVPIVASDIPTAREVISNAGLFFKPKDPNDLAEKTITLLTNDYLRSKLASRSVDRVLRNFSIESAAAKYFKLYVQLTEACDQH